MEGVLYYGQVESPLLLNIVVSDKGLCYVGFENKDLGKIVQRVKKFRPQARLEENEEKIAQYKTQLIEYLNGERKQFDVTFDFGGTPFQEAVWEALQAIPYGETCSYGDIAEKIGRPKAVRAVGSAIGANPISVIIPCHRVISKSGGLAGFGGGLSVKKKLLEIEEVHISTK